MRAYAIDEFGGRGFIRDVPDPEPADDEVLVRVHAAGISATDLAVLAGWMAPYLPHVFPLIPGFDAAGFVERVGKDVAGIAPGDAVYGFQAAPVMGRGTLAELVAIPARGLQPKPAALPFESAAVVAHSALTAVAAVDAAGLASGDIVVVLGATGGVGSFATELLAAAGAQVLAVTRTEYLDYAASLGAVEAVDYVAGDPVDAVRTGTRRASAH